MFGKTSIVQRETTDFRKRKRLDTEEKVRIMQQNIDNQIKKVKLLQYEENNPFIYCLDQHLNNSLDVINICLGYFTASFCGQHNEVYPSQLKCVECLKFNCGELIYCPEGPFQLTKLHHKYDDYNSFYSVKFSSPKDEELLTYTGFKSYVLIGIPNHMGTKNFNF
jgi:hypothetical protein